MSCTGITKVLGHSFYVQGDETSSTEVHRRDEATAASNKHTINDQCTEAKAVNLSEKMNWTDQIPDPSSEAS